MPVVFMQSNVATCSDDKSGMKWDEGDIYELIKCPACEGIILRKYYWHDGYMDGSDIEYQILYPFEQKLPVGLPGTIKKAYDAALKVRGIDANAYAVLIRRTLEMVCEDRKAEGKSLFEKLDDLAKKHEIPDKLVRVADGLRHLRNVGAHAVLGELTSAEIPILNDLSKAILEYVYSAPYLAEQADERLRALKKAREGNGGG
jgi:hypothetical protein